MTLSTIIASSLVSYRFMTATYRYIRWPSGMMINIENTFHTAAMEVYSAIFVCRIFRLARLRDGG